MNLEENSSGNTKIFVADNTDYKEKIISYFETKKGYEIIGHADNGLQASHSICELKPDIVLMECVLPGIDGFVVMDKLNVHFKNVNLPKVIFISSLTHEGFVSKAISQGAAYFLCKPVSMEVVESRIEDVLKQNTMYVQKRHKPKNKALEEKISNIFITVGIPAHIKGYQFLREAIKMAIDKPEIINSITKRLYPAIADRFDTSSSKVERAIRHAIEVAWNRGKIENINSIFGLKVYTSNDKPTNGEFIALVADKMIIEGV